MKFTSKEKREKVFFDTNQRIAALSSKIQYNKILFHDYKSAYYNGSLCIVAQYDYNSAVENYVKVEVCEKPELLLSLISLAISLNGSLKNRKPPIRIDTIPNLFFDDSYIGEKEVAKIIEWCQEYGYPFNIDEIQILDKTAKCTISKLGNLAPAKNVGFRVLDFLYQLNEIYGAFRIYQLLKIKDKSSNDIDLNAQISFPSEGAGRGGVDVEFKKLSTIVEKGDLQESLRKVLERKYNNRYFVSRISFDTNIIMEVFPKSLFDAAFYQLADFLCNSNLDLRTCKCCKKLFVAEDPRQKYCKTLDKDNYLTCYPQKAHRNNIKKKTQKKRTSK